MENHQEDILKKFLQDTFSDYEPEPIDASWSTIFSAIQPNQPSLWRKSKPWIASVLVVLIGVWLWYGSPNVEANNLEIAFNSDESVEIISMGKIKSSDDRPTAKTQQSEAKEIVLKNQSDDSQMEKLYELKLQKSDESQTGKAHHLEDIKTTQISENQNIIAKSSNILETKNEIVIPKKSNEIIVKNDAPKDGGGNHPIAEKQSDEVVVSRANFTTSMRKEVDILKLTAETVEAQFQPTAKSSLADNGTHSQISDEAENRRIEVLATDIKPTNDNSVIEQIRYIHPMESLRNKDFTLTKIALNSPVILPINTPNREAKPVRQHTYLSMSITPIQTYRILTINNNSVQNVQTNNLFDAERNGWQFDVGMIKPIGNLWNFRTNLSYLRMRQWSEYQLGTNELILRNNNSGNSVQNASASNTLEVVGQTIIESKSLHMIGFKMDVQKFFKVTGKNRYFISTGTQIMYENTQKQSNIFLNISAGFQHIISPTTLLTIEPITSYSLNNFNDSISLLQANGYNLGLKMGVSFKIK